MSKLLNSGRTDGIRSRESRLHDVLIRIKSIEQKLEYSNILRIKDWVYINRILNRQKEIAEKHKNNLLTK